MGNIKKTEQEFKLEGEFNLLTAGTPYLYGGAAIRAWGVGGM